MSKTLEEKIEYLNAISKKANAGIKFKLSIKALDDAGEIATAKSVERILAMVFPDGFSIFPLQTLQRYFTLGAFGPITLPWEEPKRISSTRVYKISKKSKNKKVRGKYVQPIRLAKDGYFWCYVGEGKRRKEVKVSTRDLVKAHKKWKKQNRKKRK